MGFLSSMGLGVLALCCFNIIPLVSIANIITVHFVYKIKQHSKLIIRVGLIVGVSLALIQLLVSLLGTSTEPQTHPADIIIKMVFFFYYGFGFGSFGMGLYLAIKFKRLPTIKLRF